MTLCAGRLTSENIGVEGALALALGLKDCPWLQTLSYGCVGTWRVSGIARALTQCE